MKKPVRAENPGLRVMIVATSLLFLTMGSGCGSEHVGEIIGMDPAPEQGNPNSAAATATASPT